MMEAQKVTVTITVEALSIDCTAGLVAQAVEQVMREVENGRLRMNDGDTVHWQTERKYVQI